MNPQINEALVEQEILNEKEKHSTIDRETGELISKLIKSKKPKFVLEVGTSIGYSGIWIASSLEEGAKLITIDRWKERQEKAKEFFKKAGLFNVDFLYGDAIEIIPKLDELFDVVFLDATKAEYLKCLNLVKLNKSALIIADNTISHKEKMKDFLDFAKEHNAVTVNTKKGLTYFTF